MKIIKPVQLLQVLLFFMILYSLFCTQTYFGTANYGVFNMLFLSFIGVSAIGIFIKENFYLNFNNRTFYCAAVLVVPYIVLLVYSLALAGFLNPGLSIKNAFNESRDPLLYVLAGCISFYYLRDKVINIIWWACIVNYTLYILEFTRLYGLAGFLHFIELTDSAPAGHRPLEVHEVTFILGFLFVYFILKKGLKLDVKLVITALYVFLGYKRILLFGMVMAIILFYVLRRKEKKLRISKIIAVTLLVLCALWVVFTSSDWYLIFSYLLGVELNGRELLMARVRDLYDLSVTYIGHGVGYSHARLVEIVRSDASANVSALHNDVLKYYIDLGFIPTVIFFVNMLYLNLCRFGKNNEMFGLKYIIMLAFLIICWLTDNLASYPNFLFAFNAIILSLVCEEDGLRINE